MPEYGLCDKSPKQIEEEQFNKEMIASFKCAEAREAEAFQRKADAENSTIQTAEILRQMMGQMQEIRDTQEVEQQARISAESKAAGVERRQEEKDRRNLKIAIISCIASVVAAVVGILTFLNVHP